MFLKILDCKSTYKFNTDKFFFYDFAFSYKLTNKELEKRNAI